MRTGTKGYYTSSLNKNNIDIQAIFFPLSESVNYSIYLPKNNNQRLSPATDPSFLLLLNNSSLNNKNNITQILLSKANIYSIKRRYNLIFILQLQDKEKFIFSASPHSNIVFKYPNLAVQGQCQINFIHLQLYPNPNYNAVILHNKSTSTFVVQPLSTKYSIYRV